MTSNLDVFAEYNGLTEELVETVGKEKVEKQKEDLGMSITEFLAQAPRKLKRQLRPEKKFGNNIMARFAKARLKS
jgi:hypothetical protein